jgi:outer membrane protein assembly factor BamB
MMHLPPRENIRMKSTRTLLALLLLTSAARAEDWPQWLGPKRNGASAEVVSPWKADAPPKKLWDCLVGPGYSVPVVSAGRVFIHERVKENDEERVFACDAKTGKELWSDTYERATYRSVLNTGPQSTPTVAGNRLFTFGITGVLSCYQADSGKRLWQVDAYKQFKTGLPRYGVTCSPLVVGNRVIVAVGGKGSSVAAFDTENGELKWQALDEPAGTASPVLFAAGGKLPDAVFMTTLRLVALNPLDGSPSWEHPLVFQPGGTAPTPIRVDNEILTSTMTNGSTLIRLGMKDDKPVSEQVWQQKDYAGYFSTGVATKERFYLITNTLKPIPSASLVSVERKTGKEIWKKSIGYFHAGAIRTGDDKLLILSDNGFLRLVEDNGKFHEICTAKVCDGTLTNPSLANGRVYVRDDKKVVCYQLAEEK